MSRRRHHQQHFQPKKINPHQQAWSILRNYGFERRVSVGGWIADFLNRKQHMAVELSDQRDSVDDRHTDIALSNAGYIVFRFHSNEIDHLGRVVLGNTEFEKSLARQR